MTTARTLLQLSIGLFITALVVRTFALVGLIVPIEVSASSMAPTLLGPHRAAACPSCGESFHVAVDRGRAPTRVNCPDCGARGIDISTQPVLAGDALWIDRTAFLFRAPRRWEVVVFRCPANAAGYCVKRIVGLPGERIDLRDGVVVVDGEVVPAPSENDGGPPTETRYERNPQNQRGMPSRGEWQLGPYEYIVLGDNSAVSEDSRTWRNGPGLSRKLLVGRPLRAVW